MKRILVPIDFSKYSEEALKVAAQIARKNKSEIILFVETDLYLTLIINFTSLFIKNTPLDNLSNTN